MGLATLLGRTWSGITSLVRPPTGAGLFRLADQYRNEGRYDEAARLVAEGLERAPQSGVGHLLSAYLHVAVREIGPAKLAFHRVLALDPHHPRALLGLARIAIEEDDLEGSKALLDRALQFYLDFPEAQALRDMVMSWSSSQAPAAEAGPAVTPPMRADDLPLGAPARDVAVTRADGTLLLTGVDDERANPLAQHVAQVHRTASATLARAGLGPLRRGVIETGAGMTFLLTDAGLILSATLDRNVEIDAGLAQIARLWTKLGVKGSASPQDVAGAGRAEARPGAGAPACEASDPIAPRRPRRVS